MYNKSNTGYTNTQFWCHEHQLPQHFSAGRACAGKNWCHNDLIGKNLAAFTRTHPVPAGVSEEASQTNYSRSNHYFWRWGTNSQGWVSRGPCVTFEWEVRQLTPVLHYYVIKLRSLNRCQCHSLIHTHTHTHAHKNTFTPTLSPRHKYITVPPSSGWFVIMGAIHWITPMCVSVCRH